MKLLIFGGSGLVSGRVVAFAIDAGYEVIAITRGKRKLTINPTITHIKVDRDTDDLKFIADKYSYDAVLDIICKTPEHARQAVLLAKHCKRLIMVSTDYVYEPRYRKLFLKEKNAVFTSQQDYGGQKRLAEEVVYKAQKEGGIHGTILRPPHIYGPGSNPGTIPKHGRQSDLVDHIRAGRALNLLYGGLGLIQPIHANDFAHLILALINKSSSYGEAYNTSGPELMTHANYYEAIALALGIEAKITAYCPQKGATDVNHYVSGHRCYDMSKLNGVLPGFTYTPFIEGVKDWVNQIISQSEK